MKFLITLSLIVFACCARAPMSINVNVATPSGECQKFSVLYPDKNSLLIEYFCGPEGNIVVEVERLDK